MTENSTPKAKNTGMAVIAYLIFFLPLLTEDKNDPFVKFHTKQAIMLILTSIAVSVVGTMIPFIGWFLIAPLGSLACLVLWIMGILNAVNGVEKELPLIGQYAKKLLTF